jgi:hypothetical protein
MKNINLGITIVVAVVVGVAAFFGGTMYQKSQMPANGEQFSQASFQRGQGVGVQGGTFRRTGGAGNTTMGDIVSIDDKSMIVKLQDGSSKIVNLSDKTNFSKTSTAAKTDFKVGDKVTAFGTAASDGSITAQMVSQGGNMMFRGGLSGPRGSGQPAK